MAQMKPLMILCVHKSLLFGEPVRFGLVGLCATFLYVALFWISTSELGLIPAVSATFASIISIVASYAGHYFFTFRHSGSHFRSMTRFLAVSVTLIAVNSMLVDIVDRYFVFKSAPLIATCLFYPLASFLLNRTLVFRRREL